MAARKKTAPKRGASRTSTAAATKKADSSIIVGDYGPDCGRLFDVAV